MEKVWTKKRLKKYCKFLTGKNIKISFKKLRTYCAWSHIYSNKIEFDPDKITKVIIWHECGHIVCDHDTVGIESEIDATMWSFLTALQRGYYRMAIDIVDDTRTHSGWFKNKMYKTARRKILNQFKDYGVSFVSLRS